MWLLGFNAIASAQLSTDENSALKPPIEPVALTTDIKPATDTTTVNPQANQVYILGGEASGGPNPNLIHQFDTFDVGETDTANFVVDPSIANIISLIGGLRASQIEGILAITSNNPDIDSSANLFLVNPAGVIFGEGARLNIPANLTVTTAWGLLFEDNYLLSVNGSVNEMAFPSSEPVEPVSPSPNPTTINNLTGEPTGYLFVPEVLSEVVNSTELDPRSPALPIGSITNQGILQVKPQATITFIGQYLQNDGQLIASGGDVNLVATSGENLLRLSQPGTLLNLDVIPAASLDVILSDVEQTTFTTVPATELARLLTGGPEQNATQIVANPDGSQTLTTRQSLAPAEGTVLVRGLIDVSSTPPEPASQPGQTTSQPGQVTILGDQINLVEADISANAAGQAGTILIGGMPMADSIRAAYIFVNRNTTISANSLEKNGGTVYIRADDTLRFYGSATAAGATPDLDGTVTREAGKLLDIREPIVRP